MTGVQTCALPISILLGALVVGFGLGVGFLVVGLIANLLIRPVNEKYFMTEAELGEERRLAHERAVATAVAGTGDSTAVSSPVTVALAWAAVGIPLAWGVWQTLISAAKLFN